MSTKIELNSKVKIYFSVSWICGLFLVVFSVLMNSDSLLFLLLFSTGLNFIINILVIIQLLVLFFTFIENRKEFFNSTILLIFNFPSICTVVFIIALLL